MQSDSPQQPDAEIERRGKAARLGAYFAIAWANAAIIQEATNMSGNAAAFEQAQQYLFSEKGRSTLAESLAKKPLDKRNQNT